jgi:hypothetical protein
MINTLLVLPPGPLGDLDFPCVPNGWVGYEPQNTKIRLPFLCVPASLRGIFSRKDTGTQSGRATQLQRVIFTSEPRKSLIIISLRLFEGFFHAKTQGRKEEGPIFGILAL